MFVRKIIQRTQMASVVIVTIGGKKVVLGEFQYYRNGVGLG